jgi:hypothetical protein
MARFYDPDKRAGSFLPCGSSDPPVTRVAGRQRFRKPILLGGEGEEEGVYGFGADLQCPFCGGKFDFILLEFDSSADGSSLAWGELDLEEFDVDLLRCPECGHRDLEPL